MAVTHNQIRETIRAVPFRPFRIHLADQREFDVRHPEFALLLPKGRTLIVGNPTREDSFEIVDIGLIVSLTTLGPPTSGSQAA